jgi:hypothetical protein
MEIEIESTLLQWQSFYREIFGIRINIANLEIPSTNDAFNRLLVISPKLSLDSIWRKSAKFFPCEEFTFAGGSLDAYFPVNEYRPEKDYAAWVVDSPEPERPAASLGEIVLRRTLGANYITLREHLIFRLRYFTETHRHLDILCPTTCIGTTDGKYINGTPRIHFFQLKTTIKSVIAEGFTRTVSL